MIEWEDVQDLGVGFIRNNAVLLFDVEKHKTGAANVLYVYIYRVINNAFWCVRVLQISEKQHWWPSYLVVIVYTEIWCVKLLLAALSFILVWSMEPFWPAEKVPFSINLRARIVVQTPLTVIETKPCVNLCINKTNVSFMSYWGTERDSVCWNKIVAFEVPAFNRYTL